jgi:hypothetical protein
MKVEEGLLLGVLEVAASKGNIELAEAAWQVGAQQHSVRFSALAHSSECTVGEKSKQQTGAWSSPALYQ